ncbi:hypothetical protein KK092_07300 [Curtobacterium flaccumfaciens pv. flaccumfaciens]|uniref:hypothetical protein n=1 Tax=Curtobacterium flaccumfaciens TaxID=2035 RepID=UPI001BDDDC20|nr:hypothetical protein [Curtobacterium flaccumfaciens]MBT1669183.1 hypothetical protein [Curtobacterium flaccumfaciens pv. flaccumfaciens]
MFEFDGRDTHAAVLQPVEVLKSSWWKLIDEPPAAWLLPHLERFAAGTDIRQMLLLPTSAYVSSYPGTRGMPSRRDN